MRRHHLRGGRVPGSLSALLLLLWPLQAPGAPSLKGAVLEPLLLDAARGDTGSLRRAHPASALADGRLRVLVELAAGVPPSVLAAFSAEPALERVVPVRVAPRDLDALSTVPGVVRVEACRTLAPLLDLSGAETRASAVHRAPTSLDGSGVVVGIVDTGLDFRHPDFLDSQGNTRLLYLLDFSTSAAAGAKPESYGARVYTEAEINAQLAAERTMGINAPVTVLHRDISGHGTHVAGIAAGNGQAASPGFQPGRFVGMAPGARIIAVQGASKNDSAFHDADVLHGIQFVFERAEAMGLPAVVNLSIGTQLGPHDGTSLLATAVSALTGDHRPGRVIVSSAGNDGGRDLHAVGYPRLDGPVQVGLQIPVYTPSSSQELVHLEVWYGSGGLDLRLTSPAGRALGPAPSGQRIETLTDEGMVKLLNAPSGPYAGNGRYLAVVLVEERDGVAPASGAWTLELSGGCERVDVFLANPAILGADGRRPHLVGPLDPDTRLTSPGTARGVITVGAYNTRDVWQSAGGKVAVSLATPGLHSYFSATGPTLDGRFVPDVSAPGQFIISALSRFAPPTAPTSVFRVEDMPYALWWSDRQRGLLRGTSQAAPHAAGVAALLLQRDPRFTVDQVRELLRAGARPEEVMAPGQGWSPRWGFGKLDAARSLEVLASKATGPVDPVRSTVGVNRDLLPAGSGEQAVVTVTPRGSDGKVMGPGQRVELWASAGRLTPAMHRAFGRYEAALLPEGRMGATARITVTVNGVQLFYRPVVHLTTRRDRVGEPFAARGGGGCAVGAGLRDRGAAPVCLLLVALARLRRKPRASPPGA